MPPLTSHLSLLTQLTRLQFTIRILKPIAWAAALGPATWIGLAAFGVLGLDLGADPVKTMQVTTGLTCIILLLATLAITPARKLTHFSELIRLRRLLGLFAFFYALLHALIYFVFDQSLDPKLIWDDTIEHPRIAVGFVAFLLLIPLALTSTNGWIRRLGKRWTRLHRLIYLATGLGLLHYLMVQKLDIRVGLVYVGIFALLMIARTLIPKGASRND
jgi:sulfoxide reductase heme-binding subunit YedZ